MEYASNSKGNTGVTLGAIGTGLGAVNALGGMAGLAGMFGGGRGYGCGGGYIGNIVTDAQLENRIRDAEIMADKDMHIAALEAEKSSNERIIDTYKQVRVDINNATAPLKEDIKELQKFQRDQMVYNGVNTTTQKFMEGQIQELMGLTQRRIPNDSVCPGWGPVEVTPVTPTPDP